MKNEIGKNVLKFLFFLGCVYGIIRVSIWSYFQTQAFFVPFDEGGATHIISHALSLLSQYGQNVVLFLAAIEGGRRLAYNNKISNTSNKTHINILEEEVNKSQILSNIYYSLFAVFAIIDSGTNLGQFFTTTLVEAKKTISPGLALWCFVGIGSLISIVVVFIEELFMNAANALLHAFNDILESAGKKRLGGLDLFIDPDKVIATRLDERNGKMGGGSMGQQSGQHQQQHPQQNQFQRQSAPQSIPRREGIPNGQGLPMGIGGNGQRPPVPQMRQQPLPDGAREPTYHPVSMGTEQSRYDA